MPSDTCLLIIDKNGSFLFIAKRRGLGQGLFNFPGGKLRPGEKPEECAVREALEEVKIKVNEIEKLGEIVFDHGVRETAYVFRSSSFSGVPEETEEAVPFWLPEFPEENVWPDDPVWFTYVLLGRKFKCFFRFSEDWKEYYGGFCKAE